MTDAFYRMLSSLETQQEENCKLAEKEKYKPVEKEKCKPMEKERCKPVEKERCKPVEKERCKPVEKERCKPMEKEKCKSVEKEKEETQLKKENVCPSAVPELESVRKKYELLKWHYFKLNKKKAELEKQVNDGEEVMNKHLLESKKYRDFYVMVVKKHDDLQETLKQVQRKEEEGKKKLEGMWEDNELLKTRIQEAEENRKDYQDKYKMGELECDKLRDTVARAEEALGKAREQLSEKEAEIRGTKEIIEAQNAENRQKGEQVSILEQQKKELEGKYATQQTLLVQQTKYVSDLEWQVETNGTALEDNYNLQKQLESAKAQGELNEKHLKDAGGLLQEQAALLEKNENEKTALQKRLQAEKRQLMVEVTGKQNEIDRLVKEQEKVQKFLDMVKIHSTFPGNENQPLMEQLDAFSDHIKRKFGIVQQFFQMVAQKTVVPGSLPSAPPVQSSSVLPENPVSDQLKPQTPTVLRILPRTIKRKNVHGRDKQKLTRRPGNVTLGSQYHCLCGFSFKRKKTLKAHLNHIKEPKMFECLQCSNKYTYWAAYKTHLKVAPCHNSSDSSICGCHSCGTSFQSRSQYKKHKAVGCAKDKPSSATVIHHRPPLVLSSSVLRLSKPEENDDDVEIIEID